VVKACRFCALSFFTRDHRKVFCNHSCSAKYNNVKRIQSSNPCENCGNSTRKGCVFCSVSCRQDHSIKNWLNGSLNGTGKYSTKDFVRKYMLLLSGYVCSLCGFSKNREDGTSILEVDHIDGNWQNSRIENLRVLCPNCHHLTETFGARNMGNGRTWKKGYNQFKSKTG
jgi:hypothetical protein